MSRASTLNMQREAVGHHEHDERNGDLSASNKSEGMENFPGFEDRPFEERDWSCISK